jgi:hypothetical protein
MEGRQVTQTVRREPARDAEEVKKPARAERAREAEKQPSQEQIVTALLLLLYGLRQ